MHTAARILLWTLGIVLVLVLAVAVGLRLFDWNMLRDEIAAQLSARLGTEVAITGDLDVGLQAGALQVQAGGIRVDGALSAPQPLLAVEHVDAALALRPLLAGDVVLEHIVLREPQLSLIVTEDGEANWDLREGAEPADRPGAPTLPVIERLEIQGGSVSYRDYALDRKISATIDQVQARMTRAGALRASGAGEIEDRAFRFEASADPLADATDWRVQAQARLADAHLSIEGTVAPPNLQVALRAPEPQQLGIPSLPEFAGSGGIAFSTRVTTDAGQWLLDGLELELGERRISGDVRIEPDREPPMIYATLHLDALPLPDDEEDEDDDDARDQLIPPVELPTDPLQLVNLQADLTIGRIAAAPVALNDIALRVELENGRLAVRPASMDLAGGELQGWLVYDASDAPPSLTMRLALHGLNLARALSGEDDPVTGEVSGRMELHGRGPTVEALAGSLDGQLLFVMREGSIIASWVEALDLDLAEWLIATSAEGTVKTPIRCAMIAFAAENGVLSAEPVVIDTRDSVIIVEGQIGLGTEQMKLTLQAYPKDASLLSIEGRIRVAGTLADPEIDVLDAESAGQGAIALALGALAGPLAALVPFLDAGLAQDQNCEQLLGDLPEGPPPGGRQ